MPAERPVPHNRWDLLDADLPHDLAVSVVVAHYEQPDQLARTLSALSRQTLAPTEVVVGDDGSRTPPAAAAPVRVVTQPDLGFRAGAARNLAAATCSGDVLVFLDADTTPGPRFVERITARVAASRDVLAVGLRHHADLTGLPLDADPADAPRLADPAWLADGYRETGDLLHADGRSFRFVISAVMACRRALFEELGGFDERWVGYGGEDWDLGYRAYNAGAVLVHEREAVAWHDGPPWSGLRAELDRQAMRLAALVPEPITRGAALPGAIPDILVDVDADVAAGADLVRTVHSVLRQGWRDLRVALPPGAPAGVAELYAATAQDRPWTPDQRARARARLHVSRPLPPAAVETAMSLLVGRDLGVVELTCDGRPCATLRSTRATARAQRWADRVDEAQAVGELFGRAVVEVGPAAPARNDLAGWFAR